MKTLLRIVVLWLAVFAATAAEQDVVGTWKGELQVDATTSLTIHFTFSRSTDGKYSAVLNAPDNAAIKNVPADSVSWRDGALTMKVDALAGSYAGTLKGKHIEGQWTQEGKPLPLTLRQPEKMSKEAMATLVGVWHGNPEGEPTAVVRFKVDDSGELQGSLSVPEQGGGEMPVSDIVFADGKLSFRVARVQGRYTATQDKGEFSGVWHQPGTPPDGVRVKLTKGEYVPPTLKLSKESFAALSGTWSGTLQPKKPDGTPLTLPIVIHFETNAQGQYVGYLESPSQGAQKILMSEASLDANKLVFRVAAIKGEYRGDLSGKTLKGQWMQGPMPLPLELTRK